MLALYRRWPVFARPVPFFASLLGAVVAFIHASGWQWEGTLQTGKLFVLILLPQRYAAFSIDVVVRTGLVLAFVVAAILSVSRKPAERPARTWIGRCMAPGLRFHPASFVLGLCLAGFGIAFFFDATMSLETVRGGTAAFVYLDYAGIAERPILCLVGVLSLIGGILFGSIGTFRSPNP